MGGSVAACCWTWLRTKRRRPRRCQACCWAGRGVSGTGHGCALVAVRAVGGLGPSLQPPACHATPALGQSAYQPIPPPPCSAGYYAVVVGKRSEALSAAIGRAYPAERLLRLSAADLEAGAAAAGLPGSDPLQVCAVCSRRACTICMDRIATDNGARLAALSPRLPPRRRCSGRRRGCCAAWLLGTSSGPRCSQEVARLSAARQQFAATPQRRRDAEREAAELAAMPGQPLCPCGCGQVGGGDVCAVWWLGWGVGLLRRGCLFSCCFCFAVSAFIASPAGTPPATGGCGRAHDRPADRCHGRPDCHAGSVPAW